MPLFSVIIPSYNRANFIADTLRSIGRQEFRDYEVIVVDDGSTDDTLDRLELFCGQIKLFRQANKGPGAARNLGVQQANGEYIAFVDSDDLWFPWTLATYARIIAEQKRPTLVAGRLRYFCDESELVGLSVGPLTIESYADYFSASSRGLYCGSGQMVVRREAFLAAGGFAEGQFNAEDHDLVLRLGTAPGFVNVVVPTMIAYRQHAEAVSADLSKTVVGLLKLIQGEREGRFAGGDSRARDRRRVLTQHVRPLTLKLLEQNERAKAWRLYRQTFVWHLRLGRVRYLIGFVVRAAFG